MFESDAPEALERLDQIERRLKAARPRPPRLDVAALERLAHETTVDPPAAVVIPRRPPGRPYRRIAVIAASWACGAVVGGLVMFVLMSHTAPGGDSANETAGLRKQAPTTATHDQKTAPGSGQKVERRDGPAPKPKVQPLDEDAGVLAMIDQLWSADSAHWPEGPTFRAGMHLIPNAADPGRVDRPRDVSRKPRRDDEGLRGQAPKGPKPYPAPAPAITRERLMREVLSETPGVVL